MHHRIQHLRRDETGMSFVFVGMGFMAFLAATTLAIDVGMLMTARSQTQNAADSAALAGAVALAYNDPNDRSISGPAVQGALNTARATANQVMGAQVSIQPADVSFLNDASGQPNRVHVQVYRTSARGNPVPTLIASLFGTATVNVAAEATAESVPANAANCVKPWAIPDRWTERQTAPWDLNDTFTAYPASPTVSADVYRGIAQAGFTGYSRTQIGTQIVMRPATTNIAASAYYSLDLPGANSFQTDVESCNGTKLQIGDTVPAAPTNTVGATQNGVADLIARDPSASWDAGARRVISTQNPSPRIVVLPVYDPLVYEQGARAGSPVIRIADFLGFFIESVDAAGRITGRIVPVSGLTQGTGSVPANAFARAIRLVQ